MYVSEHAWEIGLTVEQDGSQDSNAYKTQIVMLKIDATGVCFKLLSSHHTTTMYTTINQSVPSHSKKLMTVKQ